MDRQTRKLLKLYRKRTELSLSQLSAVRNKDVQDLAAPVAALIKCGYLEAGEVSSAKAETGGIDPSAPISITDEGRKALAAELKSRRYIAWNETRGWVTLVLAAAALVLSLVNAVKNHHLKTALYLKKLIRK